MTSTEKAIRDFCGHHADWWPSISQVKKIQSIAQLSPFKPDWDTEAVLVEEMQRMAKRIEDLEMLLTIRAEQIVGLQDEIRNLTGEE